MDCVNCGGVSEHKHHVVPKSKGGVCVVDLCSKCHSLIHNGGVTANYLTFLALFKKDAEVLCFIFSELVLRETKLDNILIDVCDMYCKKDMLWLKKQIKRLQRVHINDLFDAFEPILQLSNNAFYTKEYLSNLWENMQKK